MSTTSSDASTKLSASHPVSLLLLSDSLDRNFSFEDVQITAAENIANACASTGVSRLIHLSLECPVADLRHPSQGGRSCPRSLPREYDRPSGTHVRPRRQVPQQHGRFVAVPSLTFIPLTHRFSLPDPLDVERRAHSDSTSPCPRRCPSALQLNFDISPGAPSTQPPGSNDPLLRIPPQPRLQRDLQPHSLRTSAPQIRHDGR